MRARAAPTLRYRLGVASRILAACLGGYAVSALVAVLLGAALPATGMTAIGASVTATLTGITLVPIAGMACFWTRTAARAWVIMLLPALLFGGGALALGWRP